MNELLTPGYRDYREQPRYSRAMALFLLGLAWVFFGASLALFALWDFVWAWACMALAFGFNGARRLWEKW